MGNKSSLQNKIMDDDFKDFGLSESESTKVKKSVKKTPTSIALTDEDKEKIVMIRQAYMLDDRKMLTISEVYRIAIDELYANKVLKKLEK